MIRLVLQAAPVFSDNMVLQCGKPVPIWGSGDIGSTVRVSWESGGETVSAATVVHGLDWKLFLPPLVPGMSGELVLNDGSDEIRFRNVITGDVWFAGGQSNMEMEIGNCRNGEAELAACANGNIRFFHVVKRTVVDEDYFHEEARAKWQVCAPDTASVLSAAAYFFARKINADLNIPIGIINCSWGGTSISTWMSKEQLERSRAGQRFLDDYAAKVGGKTDAQYNAEMEAYSAEWRAWDERIRSRREKEPDISQETLNKECGPCPWPQPAGNTSPYCPANLYKSRIRRVAPYALKGFLYYQGEEDDLRAADYAEMMYYLVDEWRSAWGDERLPFLFVQLPMYASREEVEAGIPSKNWCILRENQYRASLAIANSGMAVIIDCGEYDNIHPLDKQTVGYRLALHALKKVYGKNVEADGPVFSWAEAHDGSLRLHFDNAESGLEFRGEAAGFEIAAAKGPYFPARAQIDGGCVILSSDKAARPCRARYAWIKFGPTPLYAKNGLPAMPFRSCRSESEE
ncbi:MAG: sialate O-acetylesterase [Spirochaetaceae bacterium]|nr:sialate O-acetylesterase [Spirochaetaceae bacterium]